MGVHRDARLNTGLLLSWCEFGGHRREFLPARGLGGRLGRFAVSNALHDLDIHLEVVFALELAHLE